MAVVNLCISENPRYLIVEYEKKQISIYQHKNIENEFYRDLDNNKDEGICLNYLVNAEFDNSPNSITIHPYGTLMMVTFNTYAQILSIMNNELKEIAKINAFFKAAAFSNSGAMLAFSVTEEIHKYSIVILDSSTLELDYVILQLPSFASKIQWYDNDRIIAVLLEDSSIFCWALTDTHTIIQDKMYQDKIDYKLNNYPREANLYLRYTESTEKILDFAYDVEVDHLVVVTEYKKIKILNKRGEEKYLEFDTICRYTCLTLVRKMDCILFGTSEGTVRGCQWPMCNNTKVELIEHPYFTEKEVSCGKIKAIKVSTDLNYVYTGADDGSVVVNLLKMFYQDKIIQKKNNFYFDKKNILKKKCHVSYSGLNYLTDVMYRTFMEFINAKEVDISGEINENHSKTDKKMLEYSDAIDRKRAEMNFEIDNQRTIVKNIEAEKDLTSKKLREDREKQINQFREEIKVVKTIYKEKKDAKQLKTKTTEAVIKDTKAAFEENLKILEELRKNGNDNIFNIYENMHQALKDKLRAIETAIGEKEKNFTKELNGLESKFEKNIAEVESKCNETIAVNQYIKKEIDANITKLSKDNDNYEEKIREWSKNLEELKINNSDLMESFLFNTLKLKQMNNLLFDNEKLISNQEIIVKEKRSVNDKLEQLSL